MQIPISHGRRHMLSQNTGEDLPLPRGGSPPPQQTIPPERLLHLQRMEGLDAH